MLNITIETITNQELLLVVGGEANQETIWYGGAYGQSTNPNLYSNNSVESQTNNWLNQYMQQH